MTSAVKTLVRIKHLGNRGVLGLIFFAALGLSLFQIWNILSARLSATQFRPVHLTWVLVLVFLKYPLVPQGTKHFTLLRIFDFFLVFLSLVAGVVILSFDHNDFTYFISGLSTGHFMAALIFFALVLEATRRAVGSVMMLLCLGFVLYNLWGHYLPGQFAIKDFSITEFFSFQIYSTHGLFGLSLGIAAGVVFVFVLFGALLEVSKAGDFFTLLSVALTGRFRGGPAKASVFASALLGSISGSAIANAVTTGTFTIPLMKKLGYKAQQAAGIEAAASTGGQIMPPIMGAGAFIMAQFTGMAYSSIVFMCFVPGLLYFFSTLLYVHIMARKLELPFSKAIQRRELWNIFKSGGHAFISILVILVLLVWGFTPALVGVMGCAMVVVVSWMRKHTRLSFRDLLVGLKKGAMLALPISMACATAGIIVGVVGQTGLGLQLTNSLLSLSHGNLFGVFVLTAFIALVLGMGLPVTAAYVLLSIVAVPVFTSLGLPLITAHIIVFWLSQTSNVTPPIALAAFAAAGIADARPMQSALQAFKLSSGLLIIPLMMVHTSLIYTDGVNVSANLLGIVRTLCVVVGLALSVEGFLFMRVKLWERLLLVAAVLALVFAQQMLQLLGLAVVAVLVVKNILAAKVTTRRGIT